jgi:hypothetical protein
MTLVMIFGPEAIGKSTIIQIALKNGFSAYDLEQDYDSESPSNTFTAQCEVLRRLAFSKVNYLVGADGFNPAMIPKVLKAHILKVGLWLPAGQYTSRYYERQKQDNKKINPLNLIRNMNWLDKMNIMMLESTYDVILEIDGKSPLDTARVLYQLSHVAEQIKEGKV